MVSHDMDEIIRLSDNIIHLAQGKFLENTAPTLFFQRNSNKAEIHGRVVSINENGDPVILLENRLLPLSANQVKLNLHDEVIIGVDTSSVVKR